MMTLLQLSLLVAKQWKICTINEKVVYPIEKKYVFGVTRRTDMSYGGLKNAIDKNTDKTTPWVNYYDLAIWIWTLTTDDYLVQADPTTGKITYPVCEGDRFCFICY